MFLAQQTYADAYMKLVARLGLDVTTEEALLEGAETIEAWLSELADDELTQLLLAVANEQARRKGLC